MIKKILPYILILIILVGLLGPLVKANAQWRTGQCWQNGAIIFSGSVNPAQCTDANGTWQYDGDPNPPPPNGPPATQNPPVNTPGSSSPGAEQPGDFQGELDKWICGLTLTLGGGEVGRGSLTGCVVQFFNIFYYQVPAFILLVVAHIFNVVLYASIDGDLIRNSSFVDEAWVIVRDLSNLFFIFILLYVAIKIILDLGAGEAKKIIARVIIIALLINFSMFFTKIVIDSSNVLALIFYNKLDTRQVGPNSRDYASLKGERDLSGALVENFDPTKALKQPFINKLKESWNTTVHTQGGADAYGGDPMPAGLIIGFLLIAGSLMYYVAVVLAIASVAFVIRIIELWVLIIFSPFAMMSFTLPKLASIEYIGWDLWSKRLLKVSFMAPMFLFFLYFIFLLLNANDGGGVFSGFLPPENTTSQDMWVVMITLLLNMILPILFINILLYKALTFAIKGSGKVGEGILTAAKAGGALAIGAATGGTALLATKAIGGYAQSVANNDELRKKAAGGDKAAQKRLDRANYLAKSSFDVRQTGLGKFVAKKTGLDFNAGVSAVGLGTESLKGGERARFDKKAEKEEERMKSYLLTPAGERAQKQRAEEYENDKKKAKEETESASKQYEKDYQEKLAAAKTAGNTAEETEYKKKYESALAQEKLKPGAPVDEKAFEENYKKNNPPPKPSFNEEEFRKDYEKKNKPPAQSFDAEGFKRAYESGNVELLRSFGVEKDEKDKEFKKGGSVESVKTENENRRQSYVASREYPNTKRDEKGNIVLNSDGTMAKKEIKDFLRETGKLWREGMQDMVTTPGGLATTAAMGAMTGGIGAAVAIPVGGLALAIKDMVKAQITINKDLAAKILKGKTPDQRIVDLLKGIKSGDGKGAEKVVEELNKSTAPAPTTGGEEKKE